MGFPVDMFPVLFAIARTAGWLAQWQELLEDKDQKITRPRQVYIGEDERPYVKMARRSQPGEGPDGLRARVPSLASPTHLCALISSCVDVRLPRPAMIPAVNCAAIGDDRDGIAV